jgi:hypothetical protein
MVKEALSYYMISDHKELYYKRQKGPEKNSEETSGFVRPEWVNKWPNSVIST